ncbi:MULTISPECIES: hypothetical protein [Asticcacaulis]|uniref:hypothetical protein n=1 Tax=Asticcacaulis TaxID=76890 RepID=UPI001AE8EE08|nr:MULTISPECIES: hypothetical protein [Asticcacaulis]MBP2159091.1 hypothetical protein [Asticcacaulis solisilvae]MDR6800136.1 hypothetical protein [Asticcacaulis sp. BE141]
MTSGPKFNTFIDEAHRFLVIRPIGAMFGAELVERVMQLYRSLKAPWTYNRIVDLRRYDGHITTADLDNAAAAWEEISAGIDYRLSVAMVVRDAYEKLRLPEISERFPNETICYFSDYHEAIGWILAEDHSRYLDGLGPIPQRRRDVGAIQIE